MRCVFFRRDMYRPLSFAGRVEELRKGLPVRGLYNESPGTVNTSQRYDRVQSHDAGVPGKLRER